MLERFLTEILGVERNYKRVGAWGWAEEKIVGSEDTKLLGGSWIFFQLIDNTVELFLDSILFYQYSPPSANIWPFWFTVCVCT